MMRSARSRGRDAFGRLALAALAIGLPAAAHAADGSPIPHELSPLAMFLAADIVVKGVMIGLAAASVATWTVLIAKTIELGLARRRLARAVDTLTSEATMAEAAQHLDRTARIGRALIEAAAEELRQSAHAADKAGIKERVASRISRIEISAAKAMTRGTGLLATIGSTAPFVGLFGTVWGIMNSFIGISKAQTTNLAVVAPGIAEALLATAIGLVAAIPAVVIYNHFSRGVSGYKILLGDAAAAVLRLVSRDLDSGLGPRSISRTGT